MRVLLDAHPWINCGAEPMIILHLLEKRAEMIRLHLERAKKANIYPTALNKATAAFIFEMATNMVSEAKIYCQKQPWLFMYLDFLSAVFPQAKFVHMLRDGRAVVASTIERRFYSGYTANNPHDGIKEWDRNVRTMLGNCQKIGPERCYTVWYEKLVMDPEKEMRDVLAFLEVPWDPIVLRHETVLSNISYLSPFEASTMQVKRPIHIESLFKWASSNSSLPSWLVKNATEYSPLLNQLGYKNVGSPPDYRKLPAAVPIII
ncbi:hypothetical protein P879_07604 [Paragonimus westermani]|uniref:Protein-tyrosine sulfotransferase n=1 Tax=Paragonimus westermani TaxID=34504 RepID=A0A8T0D835_9TREM|nr:hypothetical protein P879_07604 [Paragonimus westermani]